MPPGLPRLLILFGALLVVAGIVLSAGTRIPWLGRLPGDLRIERRGFRLHIPLATSLLLSVILTLLLGRCRGLR